ncbi:MAG: hypothetical protein JSV63_00785 [Candidatus Aenigmatarchaeota archaeon]|nr:MAG: hypothetical protein JSV63_00785 [Candidatus Aenigmarchaeota archaeon]
MPILARMKMVIEEEIYPPKGPAKGSPRSIHTYMGPNPAKLYPKARELAKAIFNATDADTHEEIYDWGVSGDKEKFRVRFFLHRDLDKFTYYLIRMDVKGEGSEKAGKASVTIRPLLRTEYPQDTLWQRTIFYEMLRVFWHRLFYHNKRREYILEGRNLLVMLQQQLEQYFRDLREQYG